MRLFDLDPERALELDGFFQMVKRAETDPEYSAELQNVRHLQTFIYFRSKGVC